MITGTINIIISEHTFHSVLSKVTESKEEVVGEEKMLEKENMFLREHVMGSPQNDHTVTEDCLTLQLLI